LGVNDNEGRAEKPVPGAFDDADVVCTIKDVHEPAFVASRTEHVKRQANAKARRPLLLWAGALWLLALGAIDLWRGITLWQTRNLLIQLGSSLSVLASALLILGWVCCAAALIVSAIGLWLRREWARHPARGAIAVHLLLIQVYTWGFVRTGLLWERRWSTLILGLLATALGLVALTWSRSRHWLSLDHTNEPSTTT